MVGNTAESQQIKGNIVSLLQAGACIGALTANLSADKIGRQRSVIISTLIFLFGSAIQTGAKNLPMMLFGRFAGGVGTCTMLVSMYIAEISPLNIRGRMGALWQLNISVGMMMSFWINYGCLIGLPAGDIQWRLPLALQLVPGSILFIGMLFLPESIRWLVLQDRTEEAKVILCKLRNRSEDDPETIDELNQIVTAVALEKQQDGSKWKELLERYNIHRLALGCFMQIAQQWTGTNAINYYGPLVFQSIGLDSSTSVLMTGVYGCVKVFFVLVSFFFLDKKSVGRRPTLIIGSIANVAIFCILGGMLFCIQRDIATGLIPSAAQGYIAMAMNAIIGKVTPLMIAQIAYGTFFFYPACCFTMGIIVYVFLPGTKGRSLEEMTEIFVNGNTFVIGQKEKPLLPTDKISEIQEREDWEYTEKK
ncbi:hypothetical protein MFLAVUS_004187 [Mucor flavus]|uniref:Major facilitator superfamily (MFS) profile domain-containing protein n=1 Tax=Mucor flavus TaxID=439312 RepID=A0ABP9YV68_9FUNG